MKHRSKLFMQCLVIALFAVGCSEKIAPTASHLMSNPPAQASAEARICNNTPGEVPGMTCIPSRLTAKDRQPCRSEGQDIDGKDFGSVCCPGLTAIPATEPSGAGCTSTAPPSIQICTRCGDRICGVGENRCNCPQDCGRQ